MIRYCLTIGFLLLVPVLLFAEELPSPAEKQVSFETDILPILEAKCHDCHGEFGQESNFRLDKKTPLLRGGDSGEPGIMVGNSEKSHLIRLVAGLEPDLRMPPDEDEALSSEDIALLRAWIDQGAKWPGPNGIVEEKKQTTDHWAFQELTPVDVPDAQNDWAKNPIDHFIVKRLREERLSPSGPADRQTLARRLSLDLLGLPPEPREVDAFVRDQSPHATDELIEKLLASPYFGERWASHWLDLVRFAETHGFETNRERPHAWRYRDYVIQAFNKDMPYDQFIREQIAGDSFNNPIGLGYLVAGPYDQVKSPDINLTLMQRQNELDDMINTTGTAFLGLTIGCARCHNHKFDPISQSDYYSMQAIFAGVQHADMELPLSEEKRERAKELTQQIAKIERELSAYAQRPSDNAPGTPDKAVLREAVTATGNVDHIVPQEAKFVRFTIEETNSGSQPCLDELAIFSEEQNVALASAGGKPSASGSLSGYPIHKLEHINDGKYSNDHSWISDTRGEGWVQIELAQPVEIQRIEWSRDRGGEYTDRLATKYRIEISDDGQIWKEVANSSDRLASSMPSESSTPSYQFHHLPSGEAEIAKGLVDQLEQLKKKRKSVSTPTKAYAGQYRQPGPTHRLYRGEPTAKREAVLPNAPEVFTDLELAADSAEDERRKQLADWIASPKNPLTARVIVNRIWQFHFGTGLVDTPSDFGAAGVPPTHPELLDWLAIELIDNDWSLKHIHRLIVQSATYQQSSHPNPQALKADGGTRLLWRYPPHRLEAEPIRDSILSVSGALDPTRGGPGFSAFEVEAENVRHYHPKKEFGPQDWRRMIYMTKVRMEKDAVFGLFDCPDAATSVAKRSRSTTPLQALNLFNSKFLLQQSELFSKRLREETDSTTQQITRAYQLCYARDPSPEERESCKLFIEQHGLEAFCRALLNSNEFLFIQ